MAWRIHPRIDRSRLAPAQRSHDMKKTFLIASVFAAALSACSKADTDPAATATPDPELVTPAATATQAAPPPPAATQAPQTSIPAAFQGRFGLVPADCGPETGANKGLIQVSANDMKFYESIARLGTIQERSDSHLKAGFAYAGEGMEWNRTVTMDTRDGGKTVQFEEFGEDAPKGARTYTRCS